LFLPFVKQKPFKNMNNLKSIQGLLYFLMKITLAQTLLMAALTSLVAAAPLKGQEILERRVSLDVKNREIKSVLAEIEKQISVTFTYRPKSIRASKKISLKVSDIRLHELLAQLFSPEVSFIAIDEEEEIILRESPTAEKFPAPAIDENTSLTVSGWINDDTGSPLPGVNIVEKSTTNGTTSDTNGQYKINVSDANATLTFSFIGYTSQEIKVNSQTVINVSLLLDVQSLSEVVVVGYGVQSKRNVTGAVAKVDMLKTENLPTTNIAQSLRGRVAGVQFIDNGRPGQNGTILIRGTRSINASNAPLIVLDGIFFNGSIGDINPNDIESMEVLKDASAGAIYGARAANGVILITSKIGKTDKPTIRINAYSGVSDWSYKMNLLTPERYIQKTLDYRAQNGRTADPAQVASYLQTTESTNYKNDRTVDPWKSVSQDAGIQSYDLSVSGKSDRTNYFLSGGYVKEKGLIYNDNSERISLRANLETKVTDWLRTGISSTFVQRDLSGLEASVYQAYWTSPYGTLYYDDGEPTRNAVPEDGLTASPMREALLTKNDEKYYNLFANFYGIVEIPFVKGLSYRFNYSPNYRWEHNYNFQRQDKHLTTNNTSASKYNRTDLDWVQENIITYTKSFGGMHDMDITLLYGRSHTGFESTSANATALSSDANGWNNLTLGQPPQTIKSDAENREGISSMARVNYRLKDKYLLTVTARRDGSSVFSANNKFAFFPSVAVGWVASDESFIQNTGLFDLLKLRFSYGAVGNQAIDTYQSLNLASINQYVFGDGGTTSTGVYPSSMTNPNLKWETTTSADIAIDFEMLKGKLGGTIEYYDMSTKDLLMKRTLPAMVGYDFIWTNLGATSNKGLEITLNSTNLQKGKFSWNSNVVFSTNQNRIEHIYGSDTNGDGVEDNDLGNRWFIGQPVNVAYDYTIDGIYQEGEPLPTGYKPGWVRLKDQSGDGLITAADDRVVVGQREPKYRWGLTNTFSYGGFSLSVFINAMQGWISAFSLLNTSGSGNFPERAANMLDAGWWTPENKSTTRPSLNYTNPNAHGYYASRDFVRIQDVSLAYEFPKSLLSKLHFSTLRVYASGRNLHTFTDWLGPDPESGYNQQVNLYPTPRSVTFGLNVSF
jgi:TonB-linked SusC/RagA family outer membrane protein